MQKSTPMHRYGNGGHETGVEAYGIGPTAITIVFHEGWYYLYDYERPGKVHVEEMKKLAQAGTGLSTYISQYVRDNFKRKWREG